MADFDRYAKDHEGDQFEAVDACVDITKWPEGPQAIMACMKDIPEEERMGYFMGFMFKLYAL